MPKLSDNPVLHARYKELLKKVRKHPRFEQVKAAILAADTNNTHNVWLVGTRGRPRVHHCYQCEVDVRSRLFVDTACLESLETVEWALDHSFRIISYDEKCRYERERLEEGRAYEKACAAREAAIQNRLKQEYQRGYENGLRDGRNSPGLHMCLL